MGKCFPLLDLTSQALPDNSFSKCHDQLPLYMAKTKLIFLQKSSLHNLSTSIILITQDHNAGVIFNLFSLDSRLRQDPVTSSTMILVKSIVSVKEPKSSPLSYISYLRGKQPPGTHTCQNVAHKDILFGAHTSGWMVGEP